MKILFVNDYISYSGAEQLIRNLQGCATKHGHETKISALWYNPSRTPTEQNTIRMIEDWQPDVVHFHNIPAIGFKPLEHCRNEDIPTVWTVHDWYPICRVRTRINRQKQMCHPTNLAMCENCAKNVFPLLEDPIHLRDVTQGFAIVTISNAQRLMMHDFGYQLNRITVIKNGVNLENFSQGEDKGYVFCHGVMRWEKALDWHLQSANVLPFPHVMSGMQISDFTLDFKSKVLGYLPEEMLCKVLSECSLLQFPSRWSEPCGLTMLEAFASGKPVVAVATGGVPEYLEDGKTGFLAEPGDFIGFVDLTNYLMENEELRHEMGKNALEASRYFSLERMWHDYEGLYKKAMS